MKIVEFKGSNAVYGANQPQYLPLIAHKDGSEEGIVTSCWRLSWWERIKLLFTGRIWHQQWTYNQPFRPTRLQVEYPFEEYQLSDDSEMFDVRLNK